MIRPIQAIYEHGVLRPLQPLDLAEKELVSLSICRQSDDEGDPGSEEDLPLIAGEADLQVTLEQVQAALAKLPESLVADFSRERDERF